MASVLKRLAYPHGSLRIATPPILSNVFLSPAFAFGLACISRAKGCCLALGMGVPPRSREALSEELRDCSEEVPPEEDAAARKMAVLAARGMPFSAERFPMTLSPGCRASLSLEWLLDNVVAALGLLTMLMLTPFAEVRGRGSVLLSAFSGLLCVASKVTAFTGVDAPKVASFAEVDAVGEEAYLEAEEPRKKGCSRAWAAVIRESGSTTRIWQIRCVSWAFSSFVSSLCAPRLCRKERRRRVRRDSTLSSLYSGYLVSAADQRSLISSPISSSFSRVSRAQRFRILSDGMPTASVIIFIWSKESFPRKGGTPAKSSTRTHPADHMSIADVAGSPSSTSGARYQRDWMYMFAFHADVLLARP
mmetsp:Transcript_59484/g.135882  ORF Transcript_59484/g.135882 Transcript_59484/m.135882 type:complete len:362 (-) Transcript_59484:688-1773(-)